MKEKDGRQVVRHSRHRCPPLLEMSCCLQHSWPMLVTLTSTGDKTCSQHGVHTYSKPTSSLGPILLELR